MTDTITNISSSTYNFPFFYVVQSCFDNIVLNYSSELDKSCVVFCVAKDSTLNSFTQDTDVNSVYVM